MITEKQSALVIISNDEILNDIKDTEEEIKDLQDELVILKRNRQDNRLRIYVAEGRISQRLEFIKDLRFILDYRNREAK